MQPVLLSGRYIPVMKAKSAKYLSYIEDTRKQHGKIDQVAKKSSAKAIGKAHHSGVSTAHLNGEDIVRITSSGRATIIGTVANNRRKVQVGEKAKLSKKSAA